MDRVITIAVSIAAASYRYGARRIWRQPRPSEDILSTALTPRQAAGIRQAAQAGEDIGKYGYRTMTRAKSHANHQHDQFLAGDGYRAWRDHHLELRRSGKKRPASQEENKLGQQPGHPPVAGDGWQHGVHDGVLSGCRKHLFVTLLVLPFGGFG